MKKALLVIDVQKYFLTSKTEPVVRNISHYLKNDSSKYAVIYFTIFRNDPSSPLWKISKWHKCANSPDIDICRELMPFSNSQNLFYKNTLSAAKVTEIAAGLKENKCSEVDICGFDTDSCVLATAYDFYDLGIRPIVLENLTWSTSKDKLHTAAIKMIKRNIGFVKTI